MEAVHTTSSNRYNDRPKSLKYWDGNEIVNGLLLGSVPAMERREAFEYFNITAVLSILTESQMNLHQDLEEHLHSYSISKSNENWLRFEFSDARLKGNIQRDLHYGADFINQHMDTQTEVKHYVMVHCWAGASRSPTMVAAYLIKYKNMPCNDALNLLAAKRKVARPNTYFLEQLTLFENIINRNCCVLL